MDITVRAIVPLEYYDVLLMTGARLQSIRRATTSIFNIANPEGHQGHKSLRPSAQLSERIKRGETNAKTCIVLYDV